MAAPESLLNELQSAIAKDPNSDVAKQVKSALERFLSQPELDSIPSINEFSDLLHEVTTDLEQQQHGITDFQQNDLSLLKISDKLTIYFDKEDIKDQFPKLGIVTEDTNNGVTVNRVRQATNALTMTKYDLFNCLLIGCRKIFGGISNEAIEGEFEEKEKIKENEDAKEASKHIESKEDKDNENEKKEKERKSVLDHIFSNISKYFSDSQNETKISQSTCVCCIP